MARVTIYRKAGHQGELGDPAVDGLVQVNDPGSQLLQPLKHKSL